MIKDLTESYESLISKYDKGEISLAVVFDEIQKLLKSAEPIRCKDCKYYQFADNRAFGMPVKTCKWFDFEDVDDDDFCSFGERRSDGCNCS